MTPYYEHAGITIYHGDCREILPQLPACDLLLTDPPYELGATGCGLAGGRQYLADIKGHIDGGFDIALPDRFPNWICFCAKKQLRDLLAATGSRVWSLVTWNKPNPTPLCAGNYLPDTEYIVHAYQPGRLFGEYRDTSRFIVYPAERNAFDHPTVKPLPVVSKMMRLGSKEGELIIDLFMGSGTTLRVAKDLGRRSIGVEIEERYCEMAARRLSQEVIDFTASQSENRSPDPSGEPPASSAGPSA